MPSTPFSLLRIPRSLFGPGKRAEIGAVARDFGSSALCIYSASSFAPQGSWHEIATTLMKHSVTITAVTLSGEPTPEQIDKLVATHVGQPFSLVIALGGGSVIDAGKALAAMLPLGLPVTDYLEVVGKKKHTGETLPFIAIPTTAGTGSEATANAVLTHHGSDGFKRSLRHHNFIPAVAIIDPELTLSCPPAITAACGMDALTQLLESYVSSNASAITDALIESALPHFTENLTTAVKKQPNSITARAALAYGAWISGITLANAGLGVVHGIGGTLGALFPFPHGIACGTLLAAATRKTIRKLQHDAPEAIALKKYARAAALITGNRAEDTTTSCSQLINHLEELTEICGIARLGDYSVAATDFARIIADSSSKNNPIALSSSEMTAILAERL